MTAVAQTHDVVWTPEKVADTWDFFSHNDRDIYFSRHAGGQIVKRADQVLDLKRRRVLDFGCGRGDLLECLFARGIAAKGLEFSEESVRTAVERVGDHPLFGGVASAPGELPDAAFDAIFLVEVIEHLLDDQLDSTITEARRLLAPGGAIVVTCPNGEDLEAESVRCPDCGAVFHRWQHMRSLTPASISRLFEAHGFETRVASGAFWGLSRSVELWLRARKPRTPLPAPHLLYVGMVA